MIDSKDITDNVIDMEVGIRLAGGSEALALELLSMLIAELPQTKAVLVACYNQQDWPQLLNHVHKLHGGASYCPTPRLKKLAADIEKLLKKPAIDEKELASQYTHLLQMIDALIQTTLSK